MARDRSTSVKLGAAFAAALLLTSGAQAQDAGTVSDYRLPPAASPAPKPVAGPVDTENPVATPTRSTPEPVATPAASPPIVLPPVATEPAPRTVRQPAQPRQTAPAAPVAAPMSSAQPTTAPPAGATAPPVAAPASEAPADAAEPAAKSNAWLALGAGMVLLLAALGWMFGRRRRAASIVEDEPAPLPEPEIPPSAPATLTPIGQAPRPSGRPAAISNDPLGVLLEPLSLRLSFAYATLAYRLTLTNSTDGAMIGLRVFGDLASGHASQGIGQLSLDGVPLDRKHDVARLEAGESLVLTGDMQLPLSQVLPLRAGKAMMFAPLARFLIEGDREGGPGLANTRIYTVGLPSTRRGDTMQPFRLDLGPQFFPQVQQRDVDAARWLQLDEARKTG